jgi:hypothetical protein
MFMVEFRTSANLFRNSSELKNNLDDSLYGNWKKIVGNINHKREMENQRKNLVEEIKEMSRSPNRNPQPKVGET